jgi:hypothetical protein
MFFIFPTPSSRFWRKRTYSDEEMLKFEIELIGEFMERSLRVEDYEKCCLWRDCIKRARKKLAALKPAR